MIPARWNAAAGAALLIALAAMAGCARHGDRRPQAPPSPPSDLEEAARLQTAAGSEYEKGNYKAAVPLQERSVSLREKALGPRHPELATGLASLGYLYFLQGLYERAEPLFVRALEIQEHAFEAGHPELAQTLYYLGWLHKVRGEYAQAESFYLRSLDIREKALGPMHPDVALTLHNLAALYYTQGAYPRAEQLFLRALDIREKSLGPTHTDVSITLNSLGENYRSQGALLKAEPLLLRALEIKERALDAAHPTIAFILNNLGALYEDQGHYARAEQLYLRAVEIHEMKHGAMHPDLAIALHDLAQLYQIQGAYSRAEPLYIRALEINKKVLGPTHATVAFNLASLGELYRDQGAYQRAEPLLAQALDITEKTLGPNSAHAAIHVNNLAGIYHDQRMYARAEPHYRRAIALLEGAFGSMHPHVATGLNNLAGLYNDQGAIEQAEPLYLRALEIREKGLKPMHPAVANSLNNLAGIHYKRGNHSKAESLYQRSLEIKEKALGPGHPDVAAGLQSLARVYRTRGAPARAEVLLARAAEIREAHLKLQLEPLSESRKRDLMSLLRSETRSLVSLHAHELPRSPRALELAFTTVLRRKGRILDSLADNRAVLRARLTPQSRDKLAQLEAAITQFSTRLRAPFNPRTAEHQRAELDILRARIDTLEAELNDASTEFRGHSEPVTVAKIQAALPRGAMLVELVRYHRFDPTQAQKPWQEERYLAYLLPWQGPARWVALGDAARIDAGVDAVLAAMRREAPAGAAKAALRNLDALVLAPLRAELAGVAHVILSPDDKLNLVPFEALLDSRGRYLLERQLVSYVTSGRDLLRRINQRASTSPATIIADPAYGPPGATYVRVDGTHAESYAGLPGTLAEARAIEGVFTGVRVLTGVQATKAAVMATVGPSVLHVATHGFYARGAAGPAPAPPMPARLERGMRTDLATSHPSPSEDPIEALDRAGLAFAGANVGAEGIVSARELAGRDWWGTQLVVLSACGTGTGAVPSGEGVYGLRRALVLAGAQSHVVSLWNVNDSSAPELMSTFYAELARGTGRAEALRRAKLRIMKDPRFTPPYYWASFIPVGDWAPLDRSTLRPVEADRAR